MDETPAPEWGARRALAVSPEQRSQGMAKDLQEFLSTLEIFKHFTAEELARWACAVGYRSVDEEDAEAMDGDSRTIFASGDSDVSTFYIILSGRVSLSVASASEAEDTGSAGVAASSSATRPRQSQNAVPPSRLPKLKRFEKSKRFLYPATMQHDQFDELVVAELGPGDSFGEEAILALADGDRDMARALEACCALDHVKRTYTARCTSSTLEFLAISDPSVLGIMLHHGVGELDLRPSLSMSALMEDASQRSVEQRATVARVISTAGMFMANRIPSTASLALLAEHATLIQPDEGELLYSKGEDLDFVYCLLSGAVSVMDPDGQDVNAGDGRRGGNTIETNRFLVQEGGMLVGKLVEAYVGGQDDRENHLEHIMQAAKHQAKREVESIEADSMREEIAHSQAALAQQRDACKAHCNRITELNLEIRNAQAQVNLGGRPDQMDALIQMLESEEARLETAKVDAIVMEAKIKSLSSRADAHDAELKKHADHVLRSESNRNFSDTDAARRPTQMLGFSLDGEFEPALRRSFSAYAASKCRLLRFKIAAWQELCMSQEVVLSFRTFSRQLQTMAALNHKSNRDEKSCVDGVCRGKPETTANNSANNSRSQRLVAHADADHAAQGPSATHCSSDVIENDRYLAANLAVFLADFELLSFVSPHNLLKIALRSELCVFEPHTVLATQGLAPSVKGDQVGYLILFGGVEQYKKPHAKGDSMPGDVEANREGREVSDHASTAQRRFGTFVSLMERGSVVGDSLVVGMKTASSATCVCATQVWALRVSLTTLSDASKEVGSLIGRPRIALEILKNNPEERDDMDNKVVAGCLSRTPFFEMFPSMALSDTCRNMTVRNLTSGELLFKQGDTATEVYMVLSGLLNVYSRLDQEHAMKDSLDPDSSAPASEDNKNGPDVPGNQPAKNGHGSLSAKIAPGSQAAAMPCSNSDADTAIAQRRELGQLVGKRRPADSVGQAICFMNGRDLRRNTSVRSCGKSTVVVMRLTDLLPFRPFFNVRALFSPSKMANALAQPMLRSDDDLLAIGEFLRCLPLLSQLDTSELMTLARRVTASCEPEGKQLYRCVDRMSQLYFLAEGAAVISTPDPTTEPALVRQKNMEHLSASGLHLREADVALCSDGGRIVEVVEKSDALVQLPMAGKKGLRALTHEAPLHKHSCLLVKPSVVLALSIQSVSECLSEWKHEAADQALGVLSTIPPFRTWKHKELMMLAGLACCRDFQRGDFIFDQGQPADTILFVQSGEVSLLQKGMSHVVPAESVPSKAGCSAETRPANICVATASTGSVLGLDLVLHLNLEKGRAIASKLKEVEAQVGGVQMEMRQAQKDANMSRSVLQTLRAKLNSLTRQRGDLVVQQNKVNTQGILLHKYRAVAATSVVRVLSVRRADVENVGPRGCLMQVEQHYRNVSIRRTGVGSELGSQLSAPVLQATNGTSNMEEVNAGGGVSGLQERRRFVGDVRVSAALAGQRGGLLPKEDLSLEPQQALGLLMNLRKWLRKKYGKLGSGVSVLTSFYGGHTIPDRALKELCEHSECGLKPKQLRMAITRPRVLGDVLRDEVDSMGRPVMCWADLKQTLDSEDAIVDAAMRLSTPLQAPQSEELTGPDVSAAEGTAAADDAHASFEARDDVLDATTGSVRFQLARPPSALRPSSAYSTKSQRPATGKALDSPLHATVRVARPRSALEQRHRSPKFEMDAFEGGFSGTLFSSRSQMINELKHSLGIKTEKVKTGPGLKPAKLEQLRSDYTALKGARPGPKNSLSLSLDTSKRLRLAHVRQSHSAVRGDKSAIRSPSKIHTGYTRRQGASIASSSTLEDDEAVQMSIHLAIPH